jgi:hypothetical protein
MRLEQIARGDGLPESFHGTLAKHRQDRLESLNQQFIFKLTGAFMPEDQVKVRESLKPAHEAMEKSADDAARWDQEIVFWLNKLTGRGCGPGPDWDYLFQYLATHHRLTPKQIRALALTKVAEILREDAAKAEAAKAHSVVGLLPAADLRKQAELLGYDVSLVEIGRALNDGQIKGSKGRWGRCRLKLQPDSFFSWLARNMKPGQTETSNSDEIMDTDEPSKAARAEIERRKRAAHARKAKGRDVT